MESVINFLRNWLEGRKALQCERIPQGAPDCSPRLRAATEKGSSAVKTVIGTASGEHTPEGPPAMHHRWGWA